MIWRGLVVFMLVSLFGCAWFGDEPTIPPEPLRPIKATLAIDLLWDESLGSSEEDLLPALIFPYLTVATSEGEITRLQAETGDTIWQKQTPSPIAAGLTEANNRLLLATRDPEKLLMLSADDGTLLWQYDLPGAVITPGSIGGDLAVVRTTDGLVLALDVDTGQLRWQYRSPVPALTLRRQSRPLIMRNIVIVGSEAGKLLILDANSGAPLLNRPMAMASGRNELERLVDIAAQPKVSNDGILYIASYQNELIALDLNTGRPLWRYPVSTYRELLLDDDHVYVINNADEIFAIDRLTGREIWQQKKLRGRRLSDLGGGLLWLVVGDQEGYLHWLSPSTGTIQGRIELDGDPIRLGPIVSVDNVYALDEDGELAAYVVGDTDE